MWIVPSEWAFLTFQGLVTDSLDGDHHRPTYQRGNQGPEMGRVSPSITQHMGQARAQAWRAGASHFVCCQDGEEDAKFSAGSTRLVCPGWVQDPAPLGQDGSKADLLRQPRSRARPTPSGRKHTPSWWSRSGQTQPC